jgi:hypothetical protein
VTPSAAASRSVHCPVAHAVRAWAQLEPKYWGAEIAENKIKRYFTVVTVDYVEEKNIGATFELGGAKKPYCAPLVTSMGPCQPKTTFYRRHTIS